MLSLKQPTTTLLFTSFRKHIVYFSLYILCALYTLLPYQASAHELQTNNTIRGVFHVDPDDNPIASSPARLIFMLEDTSRNFTVHNCICTITITKDGIKILELPVTSNTNTIVANNITYSYTFPQEGIYTATLNGLSTNNTFNPFSLSYNIRVESPQQLFKLTPQNKHISSLQQLIIGSLILTIATISIYISRKK